MFRISISGAHSVGKSTLAKLMVNHYAKAYNVAEIKEVARHLIDAGFKMSQEITEYGILNYINEYLRFERTIKGDILISDRSLIDLLAYVLVNSSKKVRDTFVSLVKEIVYLESSNFDYYIYVPIEIPLIEDGVRPSDLVYRENVDRKIRELLDTYNLKWFSVTGSEDERLQKAIKKITSITGSQIK